MELPHIGDQCSEKTCRQLDFLPVKCDGCKKNFCGQHWTYEGHQCPSPKLKDVQVPVCPLCDKPVASKPGAIPDEAVSRHLDRDCGKSAQRKRTPRCSKAKCKVRELIKVDCDQCELNFCLKHRHPQVSEILKFEGLRLRSTFSVCWSSLEHSECSVCQVHLGVTCTYNLQNIFFFSGS